MSTTAAVSDLLGVPLAERRDCLADIVIAEFRSTLLMADDEEMSLEGSYFDLGFTSLRITEIKDRLESLLGCDISANVLFNRPTVAALLDHLADDVLTDVFTRRT
jgi:acyl carrier protein